MQGLHGQPILVYYTLFMRKFLLAPALFTVMAAAQTAPLTPAQALSRLWSGPVQAEWFSPDFLTQVPLNTIQAQFSSIGQAYGAFVRAEESGGQWRLVFERGSLLVTSFGVDAQGRVTTFGAVPAAQAPVSLSDAQKQLGQDVLGRLFAADPLDLSLLSPEFLLVVPEAELRLSVGRLRERLGALREVAATDTGWRLVFERGAVPVSLLQVGPDGKITGLRFLPPEFDLTSVAQARDAFAALPGRVSLLVQQVGGPTLTELNASRPLAVGSTFKLAVLGEVQAQVSAGRLRWNDEIELTDARRSLPSGTLQDAPAGSRYTVADLARRMISMSDNTATDLLLERVGRSGVEARLGQSAIPSTREAFALKNPVNADLLRAYRAAGLNRPARRDVLAQAATAPLPPASAFARGPLAADVEWFVSTRRLCGLMADVAALPATQINPGVTARGDFGQVSFKGGSEPGVMNLTTQVTTKAGQRLCVSATWNDARALDEGTFMGLYGSLLRLLR